MTRPFKKLLDWLNGLDKLAVFRLTIQVIKLIIELIIDR